MRRLPSPLTASSTARADVGCSARVWARWTRAATPLRLVPIGRGCSAREGVIWSPDSLALLRRGYSGRPPGRKVPAGASAGGSRLTPGGGQVKPHARRLLGVLGDAPPAMSRRKSGPRRVRGPPWPHCDPAASPQAPPTPAEVLPRARRVTKVPRSPRNGQGGGTRCLHAVCPGRPDGWLQWAKFYEGLFIKILGGRNA